MMYGPRNDPLRRFWGKVNKTKDCWVWQGYRRPTGYGMVWWRGRMAATHRVAWEITHGDVPAELCVLHHCDNPPCVRPDHLYVGTQQENMQDMNARCRARHPAGASHWMMREGGPKLSRADAELIRAWYLADNKRGQKAHLARVFGVSPGMVSAIIAGQRWARG